jgi:parvulin-like peptidyl-prolyl isomerase
MACESVTRGSALVSPAVRRPALASVAALALVLGAASCSTFDPNAASVNGEDITRRDFEDDLDELRDNEDYVAASGQSVQGTLANSVSTDFAAAELTNRVLATLVHQEVTARRLTVDPAVTDVARQIGPQFVVGQAETAETIYQTLPEDYRATVEQEVAERLTLALALNEVTVGDVTSQIEDQPLRNAAEVCVLLIPAGSEEDAQAALDELAGGADFATVAGTYSADPTLAQAGGDLRNEDGSCPSGQAYLQLGEDVVTAMEEAEVGSDIGPLPLDQFFLVIRVVSVEGLSDTAVAEALFGFASPDNAAFGEWLTATLAEADIDVDPRYGRWDASVGGVVSPANDTPTTVAS